MKGFTLFELLVTVVIISILASAITPKTSTVIDEVKNVNLKQIGITLAKASQNNYALSELAQTTVVGRDYQIINSCDIRVLNRLLLEPLDIQKFKTRTYIHLKHGKQYQCTIFHKNKTVSFPVIGVTL